MTTQSVRSLQALVNWPIVNGIFNSDAWRKTMTSNNPLNYSRHEWLQRWKNYRAFTPSGIKDEQELKDLLADLLGLNKGGRSPKHLSRTKRKARFFGDDDINEDASGISPYAGANSPGGTTIATQVTQSSAHKMHKLSKQIAEGTKTPEQAAYEMQLEFASGAGAVTVFQDNEGNAKTMEEGH
jgi:hypothetical protein